MRILVIEDEKGISNFIKKGLEAEYFTVDTAFDGEEGLNLAQINEYDVIVLDIRLPKKNGIEVCKELRKENSSVPIIMLTVEGDVKIKVETLNAGADDYLVKPFSLEELIARIRALLRREKKITGDVLQIDDLVLDTVSHKVKRGEKEINLSRKEFALLEYLMRNPGVVLTRGMILEHVWDMNADPFTNTVDVHIRFLRKKIDEGFKKKLIKTVHGSGYKIEG